MTRTSHLPFLWGVAMFGAACGDGRVDTNDSVAGPTGTGTSTAGTGMNSTNTSTGGTGSSGVPTSGAAETAPSTSTEGSTDSTGAPSRCSQVHRGDLVVEKDTDLTTLADIGRVTGDVYITMYGRDQPNLSFLECLHTIDGGLSLQNNDLLESMKGLENLTSVSRVFVFNNPALQSIDSIGPVVDLFSLVIDGNSSLEQINLDSIKTIGLLQIGHCQGTMASANNGKLIDLSGFSGLTSVQTLIIEGNVELMTADVLDTLAANGAPNPLSFATVRYNLQLPEATVHSKLDALGIDMQHREVCGNAEGDPECFCVVG